MINKLHPYIKISLGFIVLFGVPAIFILAYFDGGKMDEVAQPEEEPIEMPEYEFTPRDEPNTEIKLPTEKDKDEVRKVVVGFIEAFHTMDSKEPTKYIERSKKYMTERMFGEYDGLPQRGTLESERIEVVSTELLPSELQDELQIWTVGVTAEQFAADGSSGIVFTEYSVMVIKEGKKWKVDGVKINGA